MISFKAFINAIHDAILAANDSLMQKNTGLLDKYFEAPEDDTDIRRTIEDAIEASKSIYTQKDKEEQEEFKKVLKGLEYAWKALSEKEKDQGEETETPKSKPGGALSPKSVVVEYPHQTSRGIEYTEVHVPLITLVPLTMSEIKEAKLTTEFELEIVDDEVQLNFGSGGGKGKLFKKKPETTFGRLEITISPQDSSEGLKRLVEGYEKALKSQIPH